MMKDLINMLTKPFRASYDSRLRPRRPIRPVDFSISSLLRNFFSYLVVLGYKNSRDALDAWDVKNMVGNLAVAPYSLISSRKTVARSVPFLRCPRASQPYNRGTTLNACDR